GRADPSSRLHGVSIASDAHDCPRHPAPQGPRDHLLVERAAPRFRPVKFLPALSPQRMPSIEPTKAAAVVTGHSRGIGEAIADRLLGHGMRVLGVSRHENAALAARHSALQQAQLDVADLEALDRWVRSGALAEFV